MDRVPTGLVTFLFTDIEGSTRLAQEFPDTIPVALQRHHSIVQSSIESCNGFIFKTIGDAFCGAFENVCDAVNAAVNAQKDLAIEKWGDAVINVRMGIHSGRVEWNGKEYMGYITLARAARVMSAAYGEQILISKDAYELMNNKNKISFRDLGERRLKDVIQPIRLYQVAGPGLRQDFPPLKTLDARPNNLPVQLASFIGREKEMKQVKGLLKKTHLLTLTGSGGSGKTRFSLQVAADVIDEFANGVWLVEFASLSDPSLLPKEIMKVFGVKEEPERSLEETLCSYLLDKEMLIIFDNCEHLVQACSMLAEKLLTNSPKLKIIATSREALKCEGEQTHRVLSLEVPDPKDVNSPEQLSQYEAVKLFIERALMVDSGFRVNNHNASALAEICYQLDGIPLAIELAAARTKILSVEKIYERLNDRFKLLTGGKRTALPRQQTLRALIDWSYDLLSEEEKILWRRLSVFTGGWTMEAAEEVCSDKKIEKEKIFELLDHLTEKSIIIFESVKERYRILETLKQYGEEKLNEANEAEDVLSKHLHYYMELSEKGEIKVKESAEKIWLEKLESDHSNIQFAIEWSTKGGDREEGARLAAASQIFWGIRGHFSTGRRLLESTLADPRGISKEALGKAKSRMGSLLVFLSDFEKSKKLLGEGLELLRDAGDEKVIADTLTSLGNVESYLGDYDQAQKLFEQSLLIGRNTGDKSIIATSLNNLGNREYVLGNYLQAQNLYEDSLALRRESGNKQGMAVSLYNLGNISMDQGNYEQSRKFYEGSLEVSREVGDKRMIASSLNCLGGLASIQGNYEIGRKLIEESLALNREIGERRNIARSLRFLGCLEQNQGNYEKAENIFNETLALTRQINEKNGVGFALNDLGNVFFLKEDYKQAQKFYTESLLIRRELSENRAIALSLNDLGNALFCNGDYEEAQKIFEESLTLRMETGEMNHIPPTLIGLSGVFAFVNPTRSVILLGAVEQNLESTKSSLDKIEQKLKEKIANVLHEKLSDGDYLKYHEEGKKLPLKQAAELALQGCKSIGY